MFIVTGIPSKRSACWFLFSLGSLLSSDTLVLMYKDLRIRNSNRPTPVPRTHKAYIFYCHCLDTIEYKVILAPSFIIAYQRMTDFCTENDLDFFWQFLREDDFEVAYSNNVLPK